MDEIRLINIKEQILTKNKNLANEIRARLQSENVFLLNLMSSPGSGKTSFIIETIRRCKSMLRIGVIEGDIDSLVDSEKVAAEGVPAVQLRTGGACHLDAPMVNAALETMDLGALDLVFIENIGNLVCPAEFDTGAALKVMLLSVPEGDDKILKYPLMFSIVDCLVINKLDYLPYSDFDIAALRERMRVLNPKAQIFEVSCKTGDGLDSWCDWLKAQITASQECTSK
ncbi:MAG: hydrogenase accessory protein HypB [Acidobacteria bacterium]|nr:MAG: hydrogenase accessory protein HypB [Acidobacteriota bacterium]